MKFLKNKTFWLSAAHVAVMGAGVAGIIMFPPAAAGILPLTGTLNALIPSPLSKVSFDVETGKLTAQKVTESGTPGIQSGTK